MKLLLLLVIPFLMSGCSGPVNDSTSDTEDSSVEDLQTLVVTDTIGVEFGDSSYMFAAIEGVIYDANGNIAVLDMGVGNVRIFSSDGQHIRTIGRRGNAPGEFQRPLGMVLLGNDQLAVMDPWGEGLTAINPDYSREGVLLDIHSNVHMGMCAVDSTDIVALRVLESTPDEPGIPMLIGRYSLSMEPSVTYWHEDYSISSLEDVSGVMRDFTNLYWTADRNTGDVFIAPYEDNRYVVYRYAPDGSLINMIEMEIEQIAKTEQEIADEATYLRARLTTLNGRDMGFDIEPYPFRRSVTGLGVSEEGDLWVRRGTEDDAVLDLWTPDGELLQSYVIPGAGLSWKFSFCSEGILAYDENPDYFQRVFLITME